MCSLTDLSEDEKTVIDILRMAKAEKFADILISFDKGRMEKCDLTIKRRGEDIRRFRQLRESNVQSA